jgi:hypothetical protein
MANVVVDDEISFYLLKQAIFAKFVACHADLLLPQITFCIDL